MPIALTAKKGLQKLNDDDFRDHHLYELLREKGPAEKIGEAVFHDRMDTIRPYPAGKVRVGEGETKKLSCKTAPPDLPLSHSCINPLRHRSGAVRRPGAQT